MNRTRNSITIISLLILLVGSSLAQTTGNQVAKGPTPKATTPSAAKPKTTMVDLNTATKKALMALPGMSDAEAQKIIANRPYRSKSDLTEKKVISADQYAKISG